MNRRRGAILAETALTLPIVFALLFGTVALGRVIYTYEMIQKAMLNLARYLGTQQGVNFCSGTDPIELAAVNNALTGTVDGSGAPTVSGLTPGMILVTIERYDAAAGAVLPCDCSTSGCDASQGGQPPGFIVVSLTSPFTMQTAFWGFNVVSIPLNPSARVPYGGT